MRNWGIVVTAFYILVVAALCPITMMALADPVGWPRLSWSRIGEWYTEWFILVWLVLLLAGPLVLLFVRVDTIPRVPERRRHVAISAIAAGQALALLLGVSVWSIIAAIEGDKQDGMAVAMVLTSWLGAWLIWAIVLWRRSDWFFDPARHALRWLIGGSVLELLIAVPSHLIVRQRNECSAPIITAFGVITGLALLLMTLGPGVLFLYRARIRRTRGPG